MLADYMSANNITHYLDLPPNLLELANRIKPKRQHGPAAPKRGIGAVSNADLFRGK